MASAQDIREKFAADLKDYTDTTAAIHLLKEALNDGAMITVGKAQILVDKENLESGSKPKIGNIVKAIMALAGTQGDKDKCQWVKDTADKKWHLEAVITIGGAVYTVDFTHEGKVGSDESYTVNIESKLQVGAELPQRGKLFFNPGHKAKVNLKMNQEGDLSAVTKKGLAVGANSFSNYPFQTEILANYADQMGQGNDTQLVLAGTGAGKSIIMAGLAQAVGKSIMIVPDPLLTTQQVKEVQSMLGAGKVNGVSKKPSVFTLDSISIDSEEKEGVLNFFRKVLDGTSDIKYDQIVLQSTHPLFKVVVPAIKDCMVMMDEAHTHTFTQENIQLLEQLKENNSVLALTATPTSKLYDLFPGEPLDDVNLGAAMELGEVRPIKPEVSYHDAEDLVTQAVVNYFNDYYIGEGMNGYTDPVKLKAELLAANPQLGDDIAQKQAIDKALELNRLRCQRNMAFSDDKTTREALTSIYKKISKGDITTIEKYRGTIATLRQESEFKERLRMIKLFTPDAHADEVRKITPQPEVNLLQDIEKEKQKDIQRTINSYALALIFGEKPSSIGEKDRTHKLQRQVQNWDKEILKYGQDNDDIPPHILSKLKACDHHTREKLSESLGNMESPFADLAKKEREIIINLILDRALKIADQIKWSSAISDLIMHPEPVKLKLLATDANYSRLIDHDTPENVRKKVVAMLETGIVTHVVSDKTVATGVSIKDVLNVQIVNHYSVVVDPDINAINGTLSGPQATGRNVRHKDVLGRGQQYADRRYKEDEDKLILTIDDVIDIKNAGQKAKEVMTTRDMITQVQRKAAALFQASYRRNKTYRMFAEHKDELSTLNQDIKKCREILEGQQSELTVGKKHLADTQQKLHTVEMALAFLPGNRNGDIPAQYRNKPDLVLSWTQRKWLSKMINGIIESNKPIEVAVQHNTEALHRMERRRDELVDNIKSAASQPTPR